MNLLTLLVSIAVLHHGPAGTESIPGIRHAVERELGYRLPQYPPLVWQEEALPNLPPGTELHRMEEIVDCILYAAECRHAEGYVLWSLWSRTNEHGWTSIRLAFVKLNQPKP